MDVYGLIYERGLIGALKYANTIEVSNPLLAKDIDFKVEGLMILSGAKKSKSFIKTAQQNYRPESGLSESDENKLLEEYELLTEETKKYTREQIARLNQREKLSIDTRRKLATSINENAVEQVFHYLNQFGKFPVMAQIITTGATLQRIANLCALIKYAKSQWILLVSLKKSLDDYSEGKVLASTVAQEIKKIPVGSKKFTQALDNVGDVLKKLVNNNLKDEAFELAYTIQDLYIRPGELNPNYVRAIVKSGTGGERKINGVKYKVTATPKTEVKAILKKCQGKTTDEIFEILLAEDLKNQKLNEKALNNPANAGKQIELRNEGFYKGFYNRIKEQGLYSRPKPLVKVPLNEPFKQVYLDPLKSKTLTKTTNNEMLAFIENFLKNGKFTKNWAPEFIAKLTKHGNIFLNSAMVVYDLKNLYDEYKRKGFTAQLVCNGLAALANIISFIPPLWLYANAISLALSVGCMFLESAGVDTKSEFNKPADKEGEIEILKKAFQNVGQTAAEKQAAYELFKEQTENVDFLGDVATVDQQLLQKIFENTENKNIPNLQNQFYTNFANLVTPFATTRIFLEELKSLEILSKNPNATVNFKIPKTQEIQNNKKESLMDKTLNNAKEQILPS